MAGVLAESTELNNVIEDIINRFKDFQGPLLPVLHGIQTKLGYVPVESIPLIARELRQTVADVEGVVSFYPHFRRTPPPPFRLEICRAEACQAVGARELERHAKIVLGVDYHEISADGRISLDPVYCLGNCACGPNIMVNERLIGRVSASRFDEIIASLPREV